MQNTQIQGKLLTAVSHGGDKALWQMARGKGPVADKAREVIELTTSPYIDITLYQAINLICNQK